MHAGDDFLPGITALAKADAIDALEVDLLRHEGFGGGGTNRRLAGVDVEQAPVRGVGGPGAVGECCPHRRRLGVRQAQQEAWHGTRQAQCRSIVGGSDVAGPVRCRQAGLTQRCRRRVTGESEQCEILPQRQRDLAAQHEHAQAPEHRLGTVGRQTQQPVVTDAPQAADGVKPALGVAIARQQAVPGRQALHVVAELAVQEGRRVSAARVHHRQVRQRHQGAGSGCWRRPVGFG